MEEKITEAALLLKRGEVGIFPTETVYGLGGSIRQPSAIQKIYALKGRPSDNPMIVHIALLSQINELAENLPDAFFSLARHFWPGPLTLVVPKKSSVSALISGGLPTIALRMPSHPIALQLIEEAGEPIAAPSANLSGKPSPTNLQDALEDLGEKVSFALEGGPCSIGIESTVVSLVHETPTLLRPGNIRREQLEGVLGGPISLAPKHGPVLSPGMKYRHYAPKAPVKLVFDEQELKAKTVLRYLNAVNLYAELRRCDRENASEIEIYCDASMQNDAALMDRLRKASSIS